MFKKEKNASINTDERQAGSGKRFRVVCPLLRQMTGSYIVTDPKRELARKEDILKIKFI